MSTGSSYLKDIYAAENLYICEIKTEKISNDIICGIPLGHDTDSLILYHLAEGGYLSDGFIIINGRDITAYYVADAPDCFMRRRQVRLDIGVPDNPLGRAYNHISAIRALSTARQLVAVSRYSSPEQGFLVGTIEAFDKYGMLLETVDEYGQVDDKLNIALNDISRIEFQSRYLGFINKLRA
ncbi:MAG: hypothetical protein AB7F40_02720 [Victivallaceae bacterium]|nr:hypothetical protein [Victivallaceae bacterium]